MLMLKFHIEKFHVSFQEIAMLLFNLNLEVTYSQFPILRSLVRLYKRGLQYIITRDDFKTWILQSKFNICNQPINLCMELHIYPHQKVTIPKVRTQLQLHSARAKTFPKNSPTLGSTHCINTLPNLLRTSENPQSYSIG